MSATYGPTSPQPFAYYDPATCSVRTSQATFDWGLTESSLILPPNGSMRSGWLYEHRTSAPRTGGSGCSSLLGTPQARDWKGASSNGFNSGNLHDSLQNLLPTPLADNSRGLPPGSGSTYRHLAGAVLTQNMQPAVELLPTPVDDDPTIL